MATAVEVKHAPRRARSLLEDRVALVTGGGRGIGRAIAVELLRSGAHVVIGDLNQPEMEETCRATLRRACPDRPRAHRRHGLPGSRAFYGAIVLPFVVFGACALYPVLDARIHGQRGCDHHLLERPGERPFRTAFGASGLAFLVLVSLGALDERMASATGADVWQVDMVWGILTLSLPGVVFGAILGYLRAHAHMPSAGVPSGEPGPSERHAASHS